MRLTKNGSAWEFEEHENRKGESENGTDHNDSVVFLGGRGFSKYSQILEHLDEIMGKLEDELERRQCVEPDLRMLQLKVCAWLLAVFGGFLGAILIWDFELYIIFSDFIIILDGFYSL